MVRIVESPGLRSAELGVWSGLDSAVPDDRSRRLAGVEIQRVDRQTSDTDDVWYSVAFKRRVVSNFLRLAPARLGTLGDRRAVADDCNHDTVL